MSDSFRMDRRDALRAAIGGAVLAGTQGAVWAAKAAARPLLYSAEQLQCELWLLKLEQDPAVIAIQQKLYLALAESARARIPDAARTLDRAVKEWSRSLIMGEAMYRPSRPFFQWGTDDTPREWLGHKLGGVGTSGDNPDAIYRTATIAGGGRFEIRGQFHKDSRPVQLLFEADAANLAKPQKMMLPTANGNHQDVHSQSMLSDRDLVVAPDGSFRITLGGEADGPNHMTLPDSGDCVIGVRDMLGRWTDKPARLAIRRLDAVPAEVWDYATVRGRVLEDLEGYVRFWSHFPDIWFGGLKANTKSAPLQRPGGWGYVAGVNFHLAPGEAMVVKTVDGGAKYTGFQINDPWMIAPDARAMQVCLNKTQTVWGKDGTATYVIAPRDPGVANWLDTEGMHDGLGILRWQGIPADLKGDGLIRDFRVVSLDEVARLGLPKVTPAERRRQVAARWAAYSSRAR
ncbi:MAG: hypothetical protein KGN34_08315 [Sphingomonadales bacterium]|nr:hypothetical protein [Sphingomonadales bacterium]